MRAAAGAAALLALLWTGAVAGAAVGLQIHSVSLPDRVRVADGVPDLVINGAGVRKRLFVNVYVAALYLPRKMPFPDAILVDAAPRRLALHVLRDEITAEQLLESFRDGLVANNAPADLAAINAGMKQLDGIFNAVRVVKKGDVILLDYLPEAGTRVVVAGQVRGAIPGADFNRALMKIWLGEKPVDPDLKKALLGGAS
ncbi:MAG: chalcone isomerase family protein [Burkholderiales bacterium]